MRGKNRRRSFTYSRPRSSARKTNEEDTAVSRFYVPEGSVKGDAIEVSGDEAHHILDVMRLKRSDEVVAFDGSGMEYVGFIDSVKNKSLTIKIVSSRRSSDSLQARITLIQAITKKDKMDYIVEKATELGVRSIIPLSAERSIPDWDESKKSARVERWRKIAREAAKQCGRADVPEISDIADIGKAVSSVEGYDIKMIAALAEGTIPLAKAIGQFRSGRVAIAIGPEGDFTKAEIGLALGAGFKPVGLGPRVLKSDTAGLAVIAIIQHEATRQ
jgi:16S rRNA (uracil1498-N3)-methyltransferase